MNLMQIMHSRKVLTEGHWHLSDWLPGDKAYLDNIYISDDADGYMSGENIIYIGDRNMTESDPKNTSGVPRKDPRMIPFLSTARVWGHGYGVHTFGDIIMHPPWEGWTMVFLDPRKGCGCNISLSS